MDLFEEPAPGADPQKGKPNIEEVLLEEVEHETAKENTEINPDDFSVADFAVEKEESKDPKPEPKPQPKADPPANPQKQKAVTRLFKAGPFMVLLNNTLGKAGSAFKPANPDFLKFSKPDREDLGLILADTVEEQNWSGIPAKYLLIVFLIIHLATCIWTMNRPRKELDENTSSAGGGQAQGAGAPAWYDKLATEMKQNQEAMQKQMEAITHQNEILRALLDKKEDRIKNADDGKIIKEGVQFYKGYDLSSLQFTDKGAMIYPDRAGQKGYSDRGAKNGTPSALEKDLHFMWKRWNEYLTEEEV